MLVNSIKTREVVFAYLFGPPVEIPRGKATAIYNAISDALHLDDLSFQYNSKEDVKVGGGPRPFAFGLARKEGAGGFGVDIEGVGGDKPLRLLLKYAWPPAFEIVKQRFEIAAHSVFEELKPAEGELVRLLAEARLRVQCQDREKDALTFMRDRLDGFAETTLPAFEDTLHFLSVKMEGRSAPPVTVDFDPLAGPKRELTVEVLRQDPHSIYLEYMSQWAHLPDASSLARSGDEPRIRPIAESPVAYLDAAREFLEARVRELGTVNRGKSK